MKITLAALAIAGGALLGAATQLSAQDVKADPAEYQIGVLADTPESFAFLQRLTRGLDHSGQLRVLPMAGKGPVQSLTDLVKLPGVDAVVIASDTLPFMEANGLIRGLGSKISYAVRLASLDVHMVAREGINSFADLEGKVVASGSTASSSYAATQLLIAAHKVTVKILETTPANAVAAVAAGKADAAILVGHKPLPELRQATGVRLVSIAAPEALAGIYSPSLLDNADYPGLIAENSPVETISSSLIIAASNWPQGTVQYGRTRRLVDALFVALQPGRDDDADINFAAKVPGWSRNLAAEDALKQHAQRRQKKTETEN